ncbi:MAG: flagellar protein [Campylobacterota bacterium]|nr:flagellar protein [Campylobacterota bacterium]
MFKWILLFSLSFNLYALEISLQGAKEDFQNYSTLHIKDNSKFLCQEIKNDFDITTKIVCAFPKSPSRKLKNLQNDFFKITTQIKNKTFFIIITPYNKLKLYSVIFNLHEDNTVFSANAKLAKHWMIVGYKKKLPYIKTKQSSDKAINFPFFLDKDKLPYVGSLDIKGNPVYIKEIGDVSDFLKIKRYYKEKKYERCLDSINDVMLEYPNSLFSAELLYYKIKVNAKLENYDEIISLAKIYLREYSADENVAEVLALIARAYALSGMSAQADYFFDRLFSEHKDSSFSKWGYIYKGEELEASGAATKALSYYEKALHETDDIDIAASAAYNLTVYKINTGAKKEANKYLMKIIKAKPSFLFSKYKASLDLMETFADEKEYLSAASIAKALIDETDMDYEEYESLMKNRGIWLSLTENKKEALQALNSYLKIYPDGLYEPEVQTAKDGLFFDDTDENLTQKLDNYDALIESYENDSIGNRAIYEKVKLMQNNEMYDDVLEFKDSLLGLDSSLYPDIDEIIQDAAKGAMQKSLKDRECYNVLKISTEYSIKLSNDWDDGIYDCAMKGANFSLAKKIAGKNLQSKDLEIRKEWLYRYIKIDFATGNYSDVIKASNELISLIEDSKDSKYKDIYRILFDTYSRLENSSKMIEMMAKIEDIYANDYLDMERYVAVMAIGSETKDDNLVLKYGNEIIKIQKSSSSHAQSPFVEFSVYQSYINKENYNKALEVIKSLDEVELSKENRARQKYLLGVVYEKLWRDDEAQISYKEAIDADSKSAWAKLAQGAKEN